MVNLLYLAFHRIFLENNSQLRHTFFGNELVRLLWTRFLAAQRGAIKKRIDTIRDSIKGAYRI